MPGGGFNPIASGHGLSRRKSALRRGDGAEVGLRPAGADQQQDRMKQAGLTLLQACRTVVSRRVAVTLQLHKGLVHGIGAGRAADLALHHRQGNAVHKQHNVRDDELLDAARRIDAELVDGMESVVFRDRRSRSGCTTGSCSPVISLTSTWVLNSSC